MRQMQERLFTKSYRMTLSGGPIYTAYYNATEEYYQNSIGSSPTHNVTVTYPRYYQAVLAAPTCECADT